jgi:hypothetical protein
MNLDFMADFSESRNQSGFDRVQEREFWRVSAEFWRIVASCFAAHRFTDTFTDSGRSDLRNSLLLKQQNLEAGVGIEPTHKAFGFPSRFDLRNCEAPGKLN